ncbi:acyltransferase [Amycolatopsis keratiniphila]|uniref:acyltransferase n=1 Tax=Amycolatopsis keratiniphila TaxID=129921 RepID=UPI00087A9C8E|nr:acyltransferase [Amycolatopsis keratiniphila]OLZ50324.1 hypothetical protein BS330_29135 [Amycolatopsis keratiniphila subsp. nogabecina]SDU67346.1 Acetyltransferase (isoleucine patch superfamily) [Amycolatopsis keratiniphila]
MTTRIGHPFAASSAHLASGARIGARTHVWHYAQVADNVHIGTGCTLGTGCYIGSGSRIGNNVKIGNHTDIFGALIEDDAMISPHVVLTEDRTPRATRPDGQRQSAADWTSCPVTVRRGATIGAGATISPGVTIGHHALVAAGAVVFRDVPPHTLILGNPARSSGWVCHCAETLNNRMTCPQCGRTYELVDDQLFDAATGP